MFRWVSSTPLGLPVVPEVYSRASGFPGLIAATRAVISRGSAASRSRPSATRRSQVMYRPPAGQADGSRTMIAASPGSRSRTGCQRASSAAPSSTAIRASQSAATYAICSGASVAYSVTPRPPAWTAPRSASTCSLRLGSISATRPPGASPSAANPAATSSTCWRTCDQVRDRQPVPASSEYASASPAVSATCRSSSHRVRPAMTSSISARCRTMSLLIMSSTSSSRRTGQPGRAVAGCSGRYVTARTNGSSARRAHVRICSCRATAHRSWLHGARPGRHATALRPAAGDQLADVRRHGPAGVRTVRLVVRLTGDLHLLHQLLPPSVPGELDRHPPSRPRDQVVLDPAVVGGGVHVDAAAGQAVRVDGTGQDTHELIRVVQAHVVRRLAEVVPGRVADAVEVRAELGLVQVQLQDSLLSDRVDELLGQDGVEGLADRVLRRVEQQVLAELLGNRGAVGVRLVVGPGQGPVPPLIPVETGEPGRKLGVLVRDSRGDHVPGDVLQRYVVVQVPAGAVLQHERGDRRVHPPEADEVALRGEVEAEDEQDGDENDPPYPLPSRAATPGLGGQRPPARGRWRRPRRRRSRRWRGRRRVFLVPSVTGVRRR